LIEVKETAAMTTGVKCVAAHTTAFGVLLRASRNWSAGPKIAQYQRIFVSGA
jgi:hypothetical protein